jgi:hypothetical protein
LLVTLAALFGLQRWMFQTQTTAPLQAELERMPGVRKVALDFAQSPGTVHVTLGRVSDLQTTYESLAARVAHLAPGAAVDVVGSSDPKLSSAAQDLSFPIAQGLATGQFVAMRAGVLTAARRVGVEARIYIDQQDVYLALYDRAHAAYFIYPREAK